MYTQMFQNSCYMGQWFLFVSQLWQMLLKLCPVLLALLFGTVLSVSNSALKLVALRLRYYKSKAFCIIIYSLQNSVM
jgi:hypothetical protein